MVEPMVEVGSIIRCSSHDGAYRRVRRVVRRRTKEHATSQPLSFQRAPSGLTFLMVPVRLILALKSPPIASLEIYVPWSVSATWTFTHRIPVPDADPQCADPATGQRDWSLRRLLALGTVVSRRYA